MKASWVIHDALPHRMRLTSRILPHPPCHRCHWIQTPHHRHLPLLQSRPCYLLQPLLPYLLRLPPLTTMMIGLSKLGWRMTECSRSRFRPFLIHPMSHTIKTLTSLVVFGTTLCLPGVLMRLLSLLLCPSPLWTRRFMLPSSIGHRSTWKGGPNIGIMPRNPGVSGRWVYWPVFSSIFWQ